MCLINKKIYTIKNHVGIKYIKYILYKSGLVVRDRYDDIEFEADSIVTINKKKKDNEVSELGVLRCFIK